MLEFIWWPVFFILPLPILQRLLLQETGSGESHALRTPYYQQWIALDASIESQSSSTKFRALLLILL